MSAIERAARRRIVALTVGISTWTAAASGQIITTLDSAGNVGLDPDVTYGITGLATVSYYNATTQEIRVATCQDVACTTAVVETIAGPGVVGGGTSIVNVGGGIVSYRDGGSLKVAVCQDLFCVDSIINTIDTVPAMGPTTAIALGTDFLPFVVYTDASADLLKVAHCDHHHCTSSTVTSYPGRGFRNVSAIIGGDGRPLIAADDGVSVHVGHCHDQACTSASFTSLVGTPFPPSSSTKYFDASLAKGTDGRGLLAVTVERGSIVGPSYETQIARCTDLACTSLGPTALGGTESRGPALTVAPGDLPLLASFGGAPAPARLQITRCAVAACGSPGPLPPTQPVETTPGIGQRPEIAMGPGGIALATYYDEVHQDLKVAYLQQADVVVEDAEGVLEGNAGATPALFRVRLSAPVDATVDYTTVGFNATSGADFLPASGTLTFASGTVSQTVSVGVVGDLSVEDTEFFRVLLSNPQGVVIGPGNGVGTIYDDDVGPVGLSGALEHGTAVVADLAAVPGPFAAADFYRIAQAPFASYEVVVDATAGPVNPISLTRVGSDGQTVVQASLPIGLGSGRSLAWQNSSTPVSNQLVRVGARCGAECAPGSLYRLRAYETTLRAGRFNNAGSQGTVLLLQNPGNSPIDATVRFWSPTGQLLATQALAPPLEPKGLRTLFTGGLLLGGQSGSITVAHTGPYGGLVGKAVALEPATGFSFDTPLLPRPR